MNIQNPSTGELRKVKQYYMVITWEPSEDHQGMDYAELDRVAKSELEARLRTVTSALDMCGVSSNFLTTEGLLTLLTSIYRREEGNNSNMILNQEYLSQFVKGNYDTSEVPVEKELDIILRAALNSVDKYIHTNIKSTEQSRRNGLFVSKNLNKIRNILKERNK